VSAPRHKRDEDVPAESKFTLLRTWAVSQHLTFDNAVAFTHNRFLIDAGVLVRSFKLRQGVNIRPDFTGKMAILCRFDANNNALRIDGVDDPVPPADDDCA